MLSLRTLWLSAASTLDYCSKFPVAFQTHNHKLICQHDCLIAASLSFPSPKENSTAWKVLLTKKNKLLLTRACSVNTPLDTQLLGEGMCRDGPDFLLNVGSCHCFCPSASCCLSVPRAHGHSSLEFPVWRRRRPTNICIYTAKKRHPVLLHVCPWLRSPCWMRVLYLNQSLKSRSNC